MESSANSERIANPYGIVGLCLSLLGIAVLTLIIGAAIAGAAFLIFAAVSGWPAAVNALSDAQIMLVQDGAADTPPVFAISIVVYIAIIVAILAFAGLRGGHSWRGPVAWWPVAAKLKDKVIWAIAVAALAYSVAATNALSHFYPKSDTWFTIPSDRASSALLFVLAVLLAPLTEELLFRGWIYTSLRFSFGMWAALIVSSALFGLAHYESTHLYALTVFPLGLALGIIRERTGSVKGSILFHALNNLIAFCAAALQIG